MKIVFGREYTESCAPKGDGICDGYDPDTTEECECNCHVTSDLPATMAAVAVWHNDLWAQFSK